jgi:predicted small lipoprotein YifL
MVVHSQGVRRVTAQVFRLFARSAVIAVLLAIALGLAACGRKSGLDAPPSAAIDRPAATGTSQEAGGAQSGFTPEGRPVAAPGAKKSLPIDVLLN